METNSTCPDSTCRLRNSLGYCTSSGPCIMATKKVKIEEKGLSVDGVVEAVASDIWVAHELCDDPEVSAELNNLWNTLVYDEDTYIGQEDVLAQQLKEIMIKYQ